MSISYRRGDKIVEFGRVYRIFQIKEKMIYFRPFFATRRDNSLTCSVPIEKIAQNNIRKPIGQKGFKKVMEILKTEVKHELPMDMAEAKETLKINKASVLAENMRQLWQEKNCKENNFTKIKSDLLEVMTASLTEELAIVKNVSLQKAGVLINRALQRG